MRQFEGKRILVLAGQDVHRKVVETAKKMGIYTIVADYLPNSPCKEIADETSMLSILDVDGIINFCKEKKIDAIVNFCNDPASRIVQQVNEALHHPNIGSWEQVKTFTDKELFKQACIRNGVDIVETYSEREAEEDGVQYPVIVKPSDSRGSRGSSICKNKAELAEAIRAARENSSDGKAIIERYMDGYQEVEITYYVIDGTPYLISFADRYTGRKEDGTDKISSCMIEPSWFLDKYLTYVDERVKKMLVNEGIRNTAIIMQGFIDGNTVRMFDPGMRFQGNEFERVLDRACGANAMESVIAYALTGKPDINPEKYLKAYDLNGKMAVQYMVNARKGTISKYIGLDKIRQNSNLVYIGEKYELGEKITSFGDTRQRVFDISFLVERSCDAVEKVVNLVNNELKVMDDQGKDMIVSKFDFMNVRRNYQM